MKKLFTLLTLLLCVGGAWGDSDPTLAINTDSQGSTDFLKTYSTEGIVLSSSTTFSSGTVQLGNTSSGYNENYLEVLASSAEIEKVGFLISGNGSNKSIQAPVFGWATTATSNTADTYRILDAVTVTANSYAAAQWFTYDFSESSVKCLRIYRTTKNISSTSPAYTGSSTALGSGQTIKIYGIKVWLKASVLSVKTQPVSAEYVSGATATALTVEAQGGTSPYSYQWYSCSDAEKTGAAAISGATSASYTPSTAVTGYYYCKVTDSAESAAEVESNVATITISAASAPTISIASSADAAVDKGSTVTLTATASGVPSPTIQWYSNSVNNSTTGEAIPGATETTYQPSTAVGGTLYYYAIATNNYDDADHTATSNVVAVEVNLSSACALTKAQFSNGFFGEITQPSGETHGTIKAWYVDGESAPTISTNTVSDGATCEIDVTTLTVTAEDGVTTAIYDITTTAVTPYAGAGEVVFDGTETWVRAPYGFLNSDESKKSKHGWGMVQPNTEVRQYNGQSRVTLFLAPCTSVRLVSGIEASDRNINVYVNSSQVESAVKFAKNGGTVDVTGDTKNPFILVVEQSATGGDAAIKSIIITPPATVSGAITASGWNTFSSNNKLDLSTISGGTAYVASAAEGSTVTLTPCTDIVAAGTGLMIKGTAGETFTINTTTDDATFSGTNKLVGVPNGGTVTASSNNYVFGWENAAEPGFYYVNDTEPVLGVGKAYLHTDATLTTAGARLSIVFDDNDPTGISVANVNANRNDNVYDLQGRRVAQPQRGLYIMNGRKVLVRDKR